jgi:signal transduction histidine kinase
VTKGEMFQFGEDLAAVQLQSVLFVPLKVEDKIIGILGAYCTHPERFGKKEVDFFQLAAGLVAIALENARSYEAIEKLIGERSRFMTRVAHNLRAPLAAVLGILEVVQGGYLGRLSDSQREHLQQVDRRAQMMISLINELLTLARSRSERQKITIEQINLKELAGRIQRAFQAKAVEKKVNLGVTIPDNLPEIWADDVMIEQLLENLVSNAIKYTPSGGRVWLAFSTGTNGTVRVEVSDNGIGIPKADIPNLFKEFFRTENAKAVEEIGTGLGLAIVKAIVDLHGGRIRVESEEGLGTIFVVHLPITQKERLE